MYSVISRKKKIRNWFIPQFKKRGSCVVLLTWLTKFEFQGFETTFSAQSTFKAPEPLRHLPMCNIYPDWLP